MSIEAAFVMYADFKSVLVNQSGCVNTTENSWTEEVHRHVPCGASLYIKSSDDCYFKESEIFRGEDSIEEFLDAIMVAANGIRNILKKKIPMRQLTQQQQEDFNNAEKCHICERLFKSNDKCVKDQDHLTGEYRGPAQNSCNLQYRINPHTVKIPCIIHNLRSYDAAHLILSAVNPRHGEITVIPNNTERYASFTIGDVTFIDSMQFMMSSLDNLCKNLKDDKLREILRYLKSSYESMYKYDSILH